jgi:hypothetical protein
MLGLKTVPSLMILANNDFEFDQNHIPVTILEFDPCVITSGGAQLRVIRLLV